MRLVDVEYGLEVICFPLNVAKMSDTQEFQSRLADLIRRIYSGSTELVSVDRLSGGASQETWLLKLEGTGVPDSLILRRAPDVTRSASSATAIGLPNEAKVIRAAEQAGVPVPAIVHVLAEEDSLGEGFLM
ncbi:MAG: phosphotransferase, partial [Henriciella sp.]|uniref:phosphotransferase n=1 Tax=Henriciella sp. TaxID=1968823 RepID=UPI003C7838D7